MIIALETDPATLVRAASGLLMVVLAAYVSSVRPRSAGNMWFAAYSGVFGIQLVLFNVVAASTPLRPAVEWLTAGALVVTGLAAFMTARNFPDALPASERRRLVFPGLVGAAALAGTLLTLGPFSRAGRPSAYGGVPGEDAVLLSIALFLAGVLGAVSLLAERYAATPRAHGGARRQLATMAAALTLYPASLAGHTSIDEPLFQTRASGHVVLALVVVLALRWLLVAVRTEDRTARNLVLLTLASALAGALEASGFGTNAGIGVARIAGVALLAYAILRHQLLGIDVKVRWGISKTTLAAVFVAVFFVVSEGAQEFFGETVGSAYVGILAAGLLVFAIAPLSRLADRLAEKAVPSATPGVAGHDGREEAFRASVRLALRGGITRREEFELARIAEAHRISPVRALELREEVEKAGTRQRATE